MHGKTPSQLRFEMLRQAKSYSAKAVEGRTDVNYELKLVECGADSLSVLDVIKLAVVASTLDDAVVAVCDAAKMGKIRNG